MLDFKETMLMKKVTHIALVLSFILFSFIFVKNNALAANIVQQEYANQNKTAKWTLYDDGKLVIQGTGEMNATFWYINNYVHSIESIEIANGITSICNDSFRACSKVKSITIPGSVTSIGSGLFYECTGLTSVTISGAVTTIGAQTFYGCTGLTSITIPGSVNTIGAKSFYGCTGLTAITIPASVTGIGDSAFAECTNL